MRKGFLFYASFAEALSLLPDAERLAAYDALVAYALEGTDPPAGTVGAIITLMRPLLDASSAKYDTAVENGKKGGRPRKEETEKKPEENQKKTREETSGKTIKKEKEIYKEKTLSNESVKEKGAPRHALGAYKHVMLSAHDLTELDDKYGHEDVKEGIRIVDEYCEQSGKRYKNYSLVLKNWGIPEAKQKRARPRGNAFAQIKTNVYDFDALERELLEN